MLDQQRLGHVERQAAVDADAGGAEVEGVVSGEHCLILSLFSRAQLTWLNPGRRAGSPGFAGGSRRRSSCSASARGIVAVLAVAGRVVCAEKKSLSSSAMVLVTVTLSAN